MCRKLCCLIFLLVMALSLTGNSANADLVDGLLIWHDFEDLVDGSGNGHDAVLGGNARIFDGLLWLDGDQDYADIGALADFGPVNPLVDALNDFTIAVAYACTSTVEGDGGSIVVSVGPAAADGSGDFSLATSNDGQYIDHWWTANLESDQSGVGYADGTVHLVVVTYEQATGTYSFYHIEAGAAVAHGSAAMADWSGQWDQSLDYGIRLGSHRNATIRVDEGTGFFPDLDGQIDMFAIWDRALATSEIPEIAEYAPPKEKATNPKPDDEAIDVPRDVTLSWAPGIYAPAVNGHIVYLSENFNDVNDGIGGITQDASSYALPQRLDFNTTYYWRVDEVNAPPTSTVFEGSVWSFTTELLAYPIDGNNITATASSLYAADQGPENSINGSGLDANDLHSTVAEDMWLSGGEPNAWIEYEFDKVHKLHQMWVWNSNQLMESALGFGLKDVTIEYSTNGTVYTTLGTTHEFTRAPAPGAPNYEHNTTVDFNGVTAKYVRLTANSN
ncbi:MAG: discoidin domain-containing protein, partial [Planctomycetes bacterium]|nr:discoidin domain-containing protein [Planctomycetota bacterium]